MAVTQQNFISRNSVVQIWLLNFPLSTPVTACFLSLPFTHLSFPLKKLLVYWLLEIR